MLLHEIEEEGWSYELGIDWLGSLKRYVYLPVLTRTLGVILSEMLTLSLL